MAQINAQVLLIYNAEGGILNALIHAVHKQFRPQTYPCSLCALTYGPVTMRKQWREFLDGLPNEIVFHHSDDFAEAYPQLDVPLPAMMVRDAGKQPEMLIKSQQLDAMTELDELVAATKLGLSRLDRAEAA